MPRVRLYMERLTVDRGEFLRTELHDLETPVLSVTFDYGGGAAFRACPPDVDYGDSEVADEEGFYMSDAAPTPSREVQRDHAGEARAAAILESFGVVELSRLDDFLAGPESLADYLVHIDADVHALCSFAAHAVPKLREQGFVIDIADDYPYRVAPPGAPWYAALSDEEDGDWFSLELGVEVDGERINLLPALVELLERAPDDAPLSSIKRLPARYRAVPVGEGKYLALDPDRLVALLEILVDLYDGAPSVDMEARFRKERALCLAPLDAVLGGERPIRWRSGAAHVARARAIVERTGDEPLPLAPELRDTLRPYQIEGVAWLQHLRKNDIGGVLADDMGLGKTLQTISHLSLEKEAGRLDVPALIVMPTSLIGSWQRELRKFAPQLRVATFHGPDRRLAERWLSRFDVVLTTYPVLVRDVEQLKRERYSLLILDEAQAVKNPRSRAHQAVAELEARQRICLSGTPVENNLDELWALVETAAPGVLGSAEEFRTRFRYPIERDGNEQRLGLLRQRVAPFVLRRTKEQVLKELPPKTFLTRHVELLGAERELYESIRVAAHAEVRGIIRKKGLGASTVAILDALMKLRQVCCHPKLVAVERARHVRDSSKLDTFLSMLETQLAEGRRVLVFSQFARMLAMISEELLKRGRRHALLTGATRDRQATIDSFQGGKVDVFLISLKAGGTGLTLTRADTVIHYEPWWNPAAQAQATDRAHRVGQTQPVFVHSLIVAGSVEERMLRLQEKKSRLAEAILADATATAALSEEDVDTLFAPLSDD
ncbi:MAG TPA: DEAD/DEAH box helicase [Polyangiaceae bacterium]|nr:DEAD/DEAH box helicase [Polyangiaceae bacterium]